MYICLLPKGKESSTRFTKCRSEVVPELILIYV